MSARVEGRENGVSGGGDDLQPVSGESGLHHEHAGTADASLLSRRVSRPGARLPRDRGVQEGHTQAQSVDGTALWRGETVARDAAIPVTRPQKGEHGRVDGGNRTESEAIVASRGLGMSSVARWGGRHRQFDRPNLFHAILTHGPRRTLGRCNVLPDSLLQRAPATAPFFNNQPPL